MIDMLKAAKAAKQEIAGLGTEEKNLALNSMADALVEARDEILAANRIDIEKAQGVISPVMIDRLMHFCPTPWDAYLTRVSGRTA